MRGSRRSMHGTLSHADGAIQPHPFFEPLMECGVCPWRQREVHAIVTAMKTLLTLEGPVWQAGWHLSLRGMFTLHAHTYGDGGASLTLRHGSLGFRVTAPLAGRLVDALVALALGPA